MKHSVMLTIASLLSILFRSPSSSRRADCGSICYGGPPGSTNKAPVHEALLAELMLYRENFCQSPVREVVGRIRGPFEYIFEQSGS
jgi:hypothetical protein